MNAKSTNACPNCKKELATTSGDLKGQTYVERDGHYYCENCGAELDTEFIEATPHNRLKKLNYSVKELAKRLEERGLRNSRPMTRKSDMRTRLKEITKILEKLERRRNYFQSKSRGIDINADVHLPVIKDDKKSDNSNTIVSHKTPGEHKLRLGQSDNRLDLALKKLEDMSASEIVTEVRKLKAKLEQMLSEQKLPAGSAGVVIDDLTSAHSETNVKLERLAKLEEIESSAEKAEKDLSLAKETISEHNAELDSITDQLNELEVEIKDFVAPYGKEKEGWEADKKYWSEHSQDPGADEFKNMIKLPYGPMDDDIGWRQNEKEGLEKAFAEKLKDKNQAQVEYESSLKLVDNMKSEREQLRNDIKNNLKPLVKKINSLYRNFISAKKSSRVVEKSNKVKKELEELKKELSSTEDQVDEHKELVQHGKINSTILEIKKIDQLLWDFTTQHDKILETLNETDDRNTSGLNLDEYVSKELFMAKLPEERERVRSFFIQRFNIPETKLVTDLEKRRLELEVDLAILRQKKKQLGKGLVNQQEPLLTTENILLEFEEARKFVRSLKLMNQKTYLEWYKSGEKPKNIPTMPHFQYKNEWKGWADFLGTERVEDTDYTIKPDPVLVEEFSWISTLETEFRKLVAEIFKDVNNWWTELVPHHIRKNARKRNDRSKDFSEWDKTQDFKLLGKLNFNAITQIFTDQKCWEYFSDVFPKPEEFQQDWLISIRSKLIDTAYCRTRVNHTHRLDDTTHEMLKGHYGFFIKCMDDHRKRNV